ncbi:hypothetical protein [Actinoplanes sp. HUAS TT8]|uniref:hypothetical protein n=1 Tax=Actinoplanes sp. HUAS TT8 TaxID=3447453 RepID=UPI003F51BFC5
MGHAEARAGDPDACSPRSPARICDRPDPVRDLVLAVYKYRYGLDEHDPLQNSELDQ